MSKFLVNKSSAILGLFQGAINIPIGGYTEVADDQAEHADVIQCKTRGWLDIEDTAPDNLAPEGVKPAAIVTENDKMKGSLTPPGKQAPLEAEPVPVPEVQEAAVETTEAPVVEEVKTATKAKKA